MKRRKYLLKGLISFFCLTFVVLGMFFILGKEEILSIEKVKASSIIKAGDFRLTAENRWDNKASAEGGKNYAELNWDSIPNLGQSGYQLNQSEDGINWTTKSLKYGSAIKVLNVYPDLEESNTLKGWMDGLNLKDENENKLIDITSVKMVDFNSNSEGYLLNSQNEYEYDVIMFGSWDNNAGKQPSTSAVTSIQKFIDSGRGVLFGHDTIRSNNDSWRVFAPAVGLNPLPNVSAVTGSSEVRITNNGYLMKYPFELENNLILTIPYAHNSQLSIKNVGTVWAEFINPSGNWPNPIYDNGNLRGGWYLKTNNNVGMIQTGHSNGASTIDERKIIANTLYNLAQVSLENSGSDYTVIDDQAPKRPEISIRCGVGDETEKVKIKVDAEDRGKEYFWNVEANLKNDTIQKSDTVSENIVSNVAGYFYEVNDSATSNLKETVEGYKDEYGRIPKSKYSIYVAPDSNETEYETQIGLPIEEERQSGRFIHVLAVDRANNISEVTSQELTEVKQLVNYEIERTNDEAKIVDLKIDTSLEKTTKSFEIQLSKNIEIQDFSTLSLPGEWFSYENSPGADYLSYSFATPGNNSNQELISFIEKLRFRVKDPIDQMGAIKIILKEKILTSWLDKEGITHYYSFTPKILNWNDAYNTAKTQSYRGLTGYLATITSEEEHDFIFDNIAKAPGWLGGTRARLKDKSMVGDRKEVPIHTKDFLIDFTTGSNWYWANGPESGEIYFTKPTRADGGSAPVGGYDGWYISNNEPNNNASKNPQEAFLQFAYKNSKLWNDISINNKGILYNKGFYTEFSLYGDQVEGEELSDSCWTAPIPQKIYIKGVSDSGESLPSGDIVYQKELRLGKKIKITPKVIKDYEFIHAIHEDETENSLNYTIKSTVQKGDKNIYGWRKVTIHLRQVIDNPNENLVIPKQGFGNLSSLNEVGKVNMEWPVTLLSSKDNELGFNQQFIYYKGVDNHYINYKETIPMGYQLVGYVMTTEKSTHQISMAKIDPIKVNARNSSEFWLTVYLKPSLENQKPYSWDYQQNDLGIITTDE